LQTIGDGFSFGVSSQDSQQGSNPAQIMAKSEYLLLFLVFFLTTGCSEQPASKSAPGAASVAADAQPRPVAPDESTGLTLRQVEMWSASCALCHVDGNAGAPIVGIAEHWQPRVAQGMQTLLQHTVEGFNSMPPLGYCMACEKEDFSAMILFMSKNHATPDVTTTMGERQ
jgi:cytochrome c5